jgi:general secretion pathway protein H
MVAKAEPGRPPTYPQPTIMNRQTARDIAAEEGGEDGFTLIEIVCVLAMIGLLVAILLPRVPRSTTNQQLEAYAIAIASLLKADRTAAIRYRQQVATQIDAKGRLLRSGATGRLLRLPDDIVFEALLPERCNERPAFSSITFFSSGTSCGGALALTRLGAGYEVRVNWLTGGVDVVARRAF